MFTHGKVSSSEALRLISESVMEAAKIEKHIAIAICGPEGELISFLRMDGASAAAARIAQNKAYTSGRDRKSTKAMGEFMRDQEREQGYWGDQGITGFGGGLPIIQDNEVIGGLGISGLSEAEDERIAASAIKKVYG